MKHIWWLLPLSLVWLWSYVLIELVDQKGIEKNWWGVALVITAAASFVASLIFTFSRISRINQ